MNTYIEVQERSGFGEDYFEENGEASIIGYFRVRVPLRYFWTKRKVAEKLTKALGSDVLEIKATATYVEAYCYKGSGDYVFTLEDIYLGKEEIEDIVKPAIKELHPLEITLVVEVSTLYC